MKIFLTLISLLLTLSLKGQTSREIDKHLTSAFDKIEYWNGYDEANGNISKYDSLEVALKIFEQQLLHITKTVPQTLNYHFDSLAGRGVTIVTSEDGLFRIYSWYQYNGGTMRFFKNIFQYRNKSGTYAFISDSTDTGGDIDAGCFYRQLNKIAVQQKTFYVALNTSIGSSAQSYHTVKIFSIEDYGLNDTAKLIKTKTGVRNELGYEMDFSTVSNRNIIRSDINFSAEYDPARKIITIPLIDENDRLTAKKIRYRFDGKYFVKM